MTLFISTEVLAREKRHRQAAKLKLLTASGGIASEPSLRRAYVVQSLDGLPFRQVLDFKHQQGRT